MKIKLKKLNENAQLPKKSKEGDFCYDVCAVSEEEIAPNIWRYGLGFAYEIDRGECEKIFFGRLVEDKYNTASYTTHFSPQDYNISIDYRPRSGIHKTGMVLCNSEGTLDEFFRGEAKSVYYHVFPNMPRYKVGDRIGQIKLGFTLPIEFEWAEEINEDTERGRGGFGSTGLK